MKKTLQNLTTVYALLLNENISSETFRELLNFVPQSRQDKIIKYHFYKDSVRSLYSFLLVRSLALDYLKSDTKRLIIHENEFGKPFFSEFNPFHFNVSHSGDWIVCAVAEGPVGVDIEEINPIDLTIAKNYFSPQEFIDLCNKTAVQQLPFFYSLWTLKESYIKAEGKGLSIPLNTFRFSITDKGIDFCAASASRQNYFHEYDLNEKYKLSLCAGSPDIDKKIKFIDANDLVRYPSFKLSTTDE